ncbi:MAG: GMP synthase [Bernardetiaceae bacterium]|nr:GMP synthase [Bernardetiaceae bacterium]
MVTAPPGSASPQTIKVAVLDLYDNVPNQGMRCIKQILQETDVELDRVHLEYDVFDCRHRNEFPDADEYDLYVSTGGPGSPFDGEGKEWEASYFRLVDKLWNHNQTHSDHKKYVFFICHSFQMMCRHFELGHVTKRRSTSFGILPIHKTAEGLHDPFFHALPDPFFAVDSRDWQVVQPNFARLRELGGHVISLEKIRPHIDLERAVMAIRISNEFFGTQFHPEADAIGMNIYFQQEEKRRSVIDNFGEQKYWDMINHLNDPDKIALTYQSILPNFLKSSITKLAQASV